MRAFRFSVPLLEHGPISPLRLRPQRYHAVVKPPAWGGNCPRAALYHRQANSREHGNVPRQPWAPLQRRISSHEIPSRGRPTRRRPLLTLAIETSCDDTCVAVLSTNPSDGSATLHFHDKVTSDNRLYGGVHPVAAFEGHAKAIGGLVDEALRSLPLAEQTAGDEAGSDEERVGLPGMGTETTEGPGSKAKWESTTSTRREQRDNALLVRGDSRPRQKPDFVSVTRGPGMLSNLSVGLSVAKGLAVAWQVPLLGVNHMQAHALTPRLVDALRRGERSAASNQPSIPVPRRTSTSTRQQTRSEDNSGDMPAGPLPAFPFLSLLVSGGHSLLVHSRGLCDHEILAQAENIAVGDAIDKLARIVLPEEVVAASGDVMYGRLLEAFAFPGPKDITENQTETSNPTTAHSTDSNSHNGESTPSYHYNYTPPARRADELVIYQSPYGWKLSPLLRENKSLTYNFSGFQGSVQRVIDANPAMGIEERRLLAQQSMRLLFEHLASRVFLALNADSELARSLDTLVLSGGVASNKFLRHVLRSMLDVRGYAHVRIVAPPVALCTDNAAMIAWTGVEMYETGWSTGLEALAMRKWPMDRREGGGILGASGWRRHGSD